MPVSADLIERIHSLTEELRLVREAISEPAKDELTGLAKKKVPLDIARGLKDSVDEFRLFLWAYLDVWDGDREGAKARLQKIRMQGAAEMLTLLADELRSARAPGSLESERLRQQVETILPLLK